MLSRFASELSLATTDWLIEASPFIDPRSHRHTRAH